MLADTSIEVISRMSLLTLFGAVIQFAEKGLIWRSYTAAKALPITQRVELIDRREFAAVTLDKTEETFLASIMEAMRGPHQTVQLH